MQICNSREHKISLCVDKNKKMYNESKICLLLQSEVFNGLFIMHVCFIWEWHCSRCSVDWKDLGLIGIPCSYGNNVDLSHYWHTDHEIQ